MTALLAPDDAIAESQRLIELLEHRSGELPFASDHLARHRPAFQALQRCSQHSNAAVANWRAALAQRWDCEVQGRRLFKQIRRQFVEHYGSAERPEVQIITRNGAEADSTPSELLADLRRLQHILTLNTDALPFAAERCAPLDKACADLERAITAASTCEAERRSWVLERRMAQEAYRRARADTAQAIQEFYGGALGGELGQLLAASASA